MSDIALHHIDTILRMTIRMHIDHLVWDAGNRRYLTKHQVLPEEAEEVAASEPVIRETYKGAVSAHRGDLGRTDVDRRGGSRSPTSYGLLRFQRSPRQSQGTPLP